MPSPAPTGHLTFLKTFGQIPWYVGSLDGQMPHQQALQKARNPPPTSTIQKFSHASNGLFK